MAVTVVLLPAEGCGLVLSFQFILGGESRKVECVPGKDRGLGLLSCLRNFLCVPN